MGNADGELWIIDSGASNHMTGITSALSDLKELTREVTVTTTGGMRLKATQSGWSRLVPSEGPQFVLNDVLYVPGLQRNLISLSKASQAGIGTVFNNGSCVLSRGDSRLVASRISSGLYVLTTKAVEAAAYQAAAGVDSIDLWHQRLGHLNIRDLIKLLKDNSIPWYGSKRLECRACAAEKLSRRPFKPKEPCALKRGQAVMSIDYVGPMETASHDGFTGMVSIMIEPFHLAAVFPVKDKSSTTQLHAIRNCIGMLKAAIPGTRVCVLKSDNADEYTAGAIAEFCNEQMISQEFSTPYTPHQNGKVERSNLVVVEMARSLLQSSGMSNRFWGDAVLTAAYMRNRCPTKALRGKTPIEALTGSPPALSKLRAFGCEAQVWVPAATCRKLDAKTQTGVLLGYGAGGQFRFWIPSGVGSSGRVVISRDAVFYEDKPKGAVELDLSDTDLQGPAHTSEPVGVTERVGETATGLPDEADVDMPSPPLPALPSSPEDIQTWPEPRQEKRAVRRTKRATNKSVRRLEFEESYAAAEEAVAFAIDEDSTTLEEAMARPDAEAWRPAFEKELKSLKENMTYQESVFRRKTHADGSLDKYKDRLVAKGFTQRFGVDYTETFSPVVQHDSIRVVLAVAVQRKWRRRQLDVETAFLNSPLLEAIYIIPPTTEGQAWKKLWKLLKALYGLKQSSRAWYETVTRFLRGLGFRACESDPCVLIKVEGATIVVVLLYVDGLLVLSNSNDARDDFESDITQRFSMHTRDIADAFVGFKLRDAWNGEALTLSQGQYNRSTAQHFAVDKRLRPRTPMDDSFPSRARLDMELLNE
ncbi:hypothetical protein PR002_g7374 [Phytophthora rubi]|uniref:Integrase catalytic domain-containing protein n=1 Tax=Phytophthora rubi TaxID=129364 RepID=A0A6A3N2N0_9STRA|nr:hypothetical protein PR002_g7374 [Phytophthora rubi]